MGKHNTEKSAWFVLDGKVQDATEEFDAIHSTKARGMLEKYYIGNVGAAGSSASSARNSDVEEVKPLIALDKTKRIPFKLAEKIVLSKDTRLFRFALQTPEHILGLPVGNHMLVAARVNGKLVMRAYTPTSSDDDVGYFDLVIKVYFKNVHPKFPDGGVLSQHFESLQIGDEIEVKGPIGHVSYKGRGDFLVHNKPVHLKEIGLIAGGTGITPCYQIIKQITKDRKDRTKVYLLYANKTEEDILLKKELDDLAAKHPRIFKLHYTLDDPPRGWKQSQGFISHEMVKKHMPKYNKKAMVMMCGPPPMIKFACVPNLEKCGYPETAYLSF